MPHQCHTPHRSLTGLYIILDREVAGNRPLTDIARMAIDGGCHLFQYREKCRSKKHMYRTAMELRAITFQAGATLLINDFSDLALAIGADGVHLGQDDLPLASARAILGSDYCIGISTHSIAQAIEAEKGGADYIGFGPLYDTLTKDTRLEPLGPDLARELCARISIPVFGIGGINLSNVADIRTTVINGIAVASAVLQAHDITTTVRTFEEAWNTRTHIEQ